MDLPPDYATEPHDEADTSRPELYVALHGAGAVVVAAEALPLDANHVVCVDAGVERGLTSGPERLRDLCIGSMPGGACTPPEWTNIGEKRT